MDAADWMLEHADTYVPIMTLATPPHKIDNV